MCMCVTHVPEDGGRREEERACVLGVCKPKEVGTALPSPPPLTFRPSFAFTPNAQMFAIWLFVSFPLTVVGTLFGRHWAGSKADFPCRVRVTCVHHLVFLCECTHKFGTNRRSSPPVAPYKNP